MKRLLATMSCDVRLQLRNGFYWAVAFLLAVFAVIISRLPEFDWGPLLPALVLGNLVVATFMFMGGLVLLEKEEGTLEAQIVTPLGVGEYLASKVVTLTGLSIVENVAIVILAAGLGFSALPLVLGIVLASAIYILVGFVAVARYDSINEYLFPSMLYTAVFALPFLHYAGVWRSPLMYLHPLQAPLVVLTGMVAPLAAWEWAYGIVYSLLWIGLTLAWSRRTFQRFVVARAGAH
jgi:fluoroquinolone transport system permease protein